MDDDMDRSMLGDVGGGNDVAFFDISTGILFEDAFNVNVINPGGQKFDRVNRMLCKAVTFGMDLILDYNSEIFRVRVGEELSIVISSTLSLDGVPDEDQYRPIEHETTMASEYEYVMHGRVFKFDRLRERVIQVSASFGGLLMRITGEQRHLMHLKLDQRIYLLIKHKNATDKNSLS